MLPSRLSFPEVLKKDDKEHKGVFKYRAITFYGRPFQERSFNQPLSKCSPPRDPSPTLIKPVKGLRTSSPYNPRSCFASAQHSNPKFKSQKSKLLSKFSKKILTPLCRRQFLKFAFCILNYEFVLNKSEAQTSLDYFPFRSPLLRESPRASREKIQTTKHQNPNNIQ